jgi:hypothetical protein
MKDENLMLDSNNQSFGQIRAIGILLIVIALVLFFVSDTLLSLGSDASQSVKITAFSFLTIAIALRPIFHRMFVLVVPIGFMLLIGLAQTFSIEAGVEEFIRFLFPMFISIAIYAYRDNLGFLISTLIVVVASNDLFQCYFFIAYITGLPLFLPVRIDSGVFLRAQGWLGFFSEFAYINFCAFVLCREFGKSQRDKYRSYGFAFFAAVAFSFKLIAVAVLYPLTARKFGFRGWVILGVSSALIVGAAFGGMFDSFWNVAASKIGFYITQGNSARAESYRVMFESIAGGNIFGEGLGAFGGPASVRLNSPLYAKYHFNWYGLGGILKTTDTFYPHLFVEIGLFGAILWLIFIIFYGQGSAKGRVWKFFVIVLLFDNFFSMSLLSPAYIFSALIVMYALSRRSARWSAFGLSNSGA